MIRNAGGVATEDAIRSLVISQRLLGTEEIVLIHHTDCGMLTFKDDAVKDQIEADTGIRPAFALEAFPELEADVRQTAARIQASPFVPHKAIRGFVYDVHTGKLRGSLARTSVLTARRAPADQPGRTGAVRGPALAARSGFHRARARSAGPGTTTPPPRWRRPATAKAKASWRPELKAEAIRRGKKLLTGELGHRRTGQLGHGLGPEQVLDGVVAEEGREEDRDGRQVGGPLGDRRRYPMGPEPGHQRGRQDRGQAEDHEAEEDADGEHLGRVLEGGVHPAPGAAVLGGQAVHHRGPVGRREAAGTDAVEEDDGREDHVDEVDREQVEEDKRQAGGDHPAGGEQARAVAVGQVAGERTGDQDAERQRHHGDPGPERGLREVEAVQGQPDALQPDDEHEHQPAPGQGGQEARQGPEGEGPDLEQVQVEHGVLHPGFDHDEDGQEDHADAPGRPGPWDWSSP